MGQFNGSPRQVIIDVLPNGLSLNIRVVNDEKYDMDQVENDVRAIVDSLRSMSLPSLSVDQEGYASRIWQETTAEIQSGERFVSLSMNLSEAGGMESNLLINTDRILADALALFATQSEVQLHLLDPKLISLHAKDIAQRVATHASTTSACGRALTHQATYDSKE